jgi:hypothetical protein
VRPGYACRDHPAATYREENLTQTQSEAARLAQTLLATVFNKSEVATLLALPITWVATHSNAIPGAFRLGRNLQVRATFRRRFWAEIGLASTIGLLALVTPIFPDWIEFVSRWDPDQHDGSVEWLIVIGLFVVTTGIFAVATMEWRRPTHASDADGAL